MFMALGWKLVQVGLGFRVNLFHGILGVQRLHFFAVSAYIRKYTTELVQNDPM